MISNIKNINSNVAALLKDIDTDDVVKQTRLTWKDIVGLCRTTESTRLKRLEKFATCLGTTIAELTLNADVETNWYEEARAEYIAENLTNLRLENNAAVMDIADEIDFAHAYNAAARIRSYESGQALPTLGMLQKLADLYEVEVADLMLPNEPR